MNLKRIPIDLAGCHTIAGQGGIRGPKFSSVADRLNGDHIVIQIPNGGYKMTASTYNRCANELKAIVAFFKPLKCGQPYVPPSQSQVP